MGSRDRKMAATLLYAYYRLGKAYAGASDEQRLAMGLFLTCTESHPVLTFLDPELDGQVALAIKEKWAIAEEKGCFAKAIFPGLDQLSEGMDADTFTASLIVQPDLFLRARKNYLKQILAKLEQDNCPFEVNGLTIRLPNARNLQAIFSADQHAWFEVQDDSSQKTGELFRPQKGESWWDCCAASGGKSLLLLEQEKQIKLTVSDIRESSLRNLDERFSLSGNTYALRRIIDLTKPITILQHQSFDGIILDAPCTGSGTWGRSPEMLSTFDIQKIRGFQELQFSIAKNVVQFLKPGKALIYSTCSVYAAENEEQTARMAAELGLELEEQKLIKGYGHKADTLFVARFRRKA